MTEKFTTLKKKYDSLKESSACAEANEQRVIAQNRELKKSMVDLTQWSNDLKANTEKKLAASFETASKFRTMYLDKETREAKVSHELKIAKSELGNRDETLAEALAKLSQQEGELSKAGQAASAADRLQAQLSEQLKVATSEIASKDKQLESLREELANASSMASKFEAADCSAKAAEAKLSHMEKENKDLKARAYDDLQKVNDLEAYLKDKSLELEETTAMCEELMSREEKRSRACAQ